MLQKFTFSYERYDGLGEMGTPVEEVTFISRDKIALPELIEFFEQFLKGAGYVLPDGVHLGYEEDDC